MNLVGHQQGAAFHAKLCHFPQLLRLPDPSHRVLGVTQQEDFALFYLFGEVVKVDAPFSVRFHQRVFQHFPSPGLRHIVKFRVHRGLDENFVAISAEQLDEGGQGGHHAKTPAHEGNVRRPALASLLPLLHRLKIAVRAGGIAPDALLSLGNAGVDDGLGGAEVHVRHPQGDDIGGAEFFGAFVILGAAVSAAVNDFVKVVFHKPLLFSANSCQLSTQYTAFPRKAQAPAPRNRDGHWD